MVPGSIWKLTDLGREAIIILRNFGTVKLLCDLKLHYLFNKGHPSKVTVVDLVILMVVGTSYAIYLNWIMVPDKIIDGNEACVSSIIMCNQ